MSSWSKAIYHRQNGQYYKYTEKRQGPDILDARTAEALEDGSSEFHDHFFKRDGVWYVQSKIDGRHLFEEKNPGGRGIEQISSGEYLDALLGELKRLG
jgi:hypothetical protein